MDSVKEFVKEYKKQLLVIAVLGITYNFGFRKGFSSAERGMTYIFEEAARTLPIAKF